MIDIIPFKKPKKKVIKKEVKLAIPILKKSKPAHLQEGLEVSEELAKLFAGKYGKIADEQVKLITSFQKKEKKYIDLEKKFLSSQKRLLKSTYKTYSKDFSLSKKEVKEEISFLIKIAEEQFIKANKHYYDFLKFLKKLKSDI